MPCNRREILSAIVVGSIFYPVNVVALPVGFADFVNAIGQDIAQSTAVISAAAENIDKATASGLHIYDVIHIKILNNIMHSIQGNMMLVNGKKRFNIDSFRDYLEIGQNDASSWSGITHQCGTIATELANLLGRFEDNPSVIIAGVGFNNAGDLDAALQRQASIYARLSVLPEPATSDDRKLLSSIVDKLDNLRKTVIDFETSIEKYLNKPG